MSLQKKILLSTVLIIALMTFSAVVFFAWQEQQKITEAADNQTQEVMQELDRLLEVTDSIMAERVKSSMALLIERIEEQGIPDQGPSVQINDQAVPQLFIGDQAQAEHYDLVDGLTRIMGGTATLFSRRGDDFVRVSTNVRRADGERAIGTLLDPQGAAIRALLEGEAFYGQVDILGNPFLTGYEPIHNQQGQVIGIAYVGYSADLNTLNNVIAATRILDSGFVALLDARGNLRFHSEHLQTGEIQEGLENTGNWILHEQQFTPWGYQIVAGYPVQEVQQRILQASGTILLTLAAAGTLLSLLLVVLLRRMVVRPLELTIHALEDLAEGGGDLTRRFNSTARDELGHMARSFDKLLERLQGSIRDTTNSLTPLAKSVDQLKVISRESTESLRNQNESTEQVATAIQEMHHSARSVAEHAREGEQASEKAVQLASEGSSLMDELVGGINEQAKGTETLVEVTSELSEASQSITVVLEVINDIAEQTNLLALNAAIEAARAGDHGRGFAVVADEVRSLASRTQSSTEEIRQMIDRMQLAVGRARKLMADAQEQMQKNVGKADVSGEAFKNILATLDQINSVNVQVASAAMQQSQVSADISEKISLIHDSSEFNLGKMEEVSAQSEALLTSCDQIQKKLAYYRT
ncbi:Methyl-accepting chemotaxis protein [Marinospirillum celere]|uniref:Methyl-accepting chemotaxis protein n=1 Tax=Marinospirillum celere TaxID=1122252 RepID=A0A1I1DRU0_9GAMM|nr:Cache 3/Cache 2 fusion domain-containing protein [Marinospirillum celere]SFB77621.1 Methyl-accepting chemotaxis protein [Marinospirillum celere]